MIISPEEKRALRRLQADRMLKKKELAEQLGITRSTLRNIINNDEPQKVNTRTYQNIAKTIASNY